MPRITEMYAFVMSDANPDDEGIVGVTTGNGFLPLVGADMDRVASLIPLARSIARKQGKQVRVLKFAGPPEVIVTEEPDGG